MSRLRTLNKGITKPVFVDFHDDALQKRVDDLEVAIESLQSAEEERVIVVEKALDYAEGLESIVMDILEQEPAQHADARRRLRGKLGSAFA
ncbi:hypothetical protein FS837_006677 [Tulasnella sp. UAMH 9824]|nr:hypothetical protein FS837_006677 [Tulasnella sp. UAMH 9824]